MAFLGERLSEKEMAAVTWKVTKMADFTNHELSDVLKAEEMVFLANMFVETPESLAATVKEHEAYLASKFAVGEKAGRILG